MGYEAFHATNGGGMLELLTVGTDACEGPPPFGDFIVPK